MLVAHIPLDDYERLRAAIKRVHDLHVPEGGPGPERCAACGHPIPCPTALALDGEA